MAERYTRLYSLTENLYQSGAPVLIAAGALLKDNQTNKTLAQIKLQSLSDKPIKAAKISITPLDVVGNKLGETIEHQYLDLNIRRDEAFGAKSPIALPDATTRAFRAAVTSVVFADNSVWEASNAAWEPLPKPATLAEAYPDAELRKQFKLEFGAQSQYAYDEFSDLCRCPCGALNRQGEAKCHVCGCDLPALRGMDIAELEKRKDERLEQERIAEEKRQERERIAKEKAAAEAAEQAKKIRKIAKIAVPIAVVVIAFGVLLSTVIVPNARYNKAVSMMKSGQYNEAIAAFEAMDGYKDSAEKIEECKDTMLKTAKTGDYVHFGSYEQDNDTSNGKEDIEWLVLDVQDGKALLISRYALDCQPYNEEGKGITWRLCTLRKWLNNEFLKTAFSKEEKALIPTATVSADMNPGYSTNAGRETQDQVFLLSVLESTEYFTSDDTRVCRATDYAVANGADVADDGNCGWWLRSPGNDSVNATFVYTEGIINYEGGDVRASNVAVRPAIWVDLSE